MSRTPEPSDPDPELRSPSRLESVDAHIRHAVSVHTATVRTAGTTDSALRAAVLERAAGGSPIAEPYDALAKQIGEAAYRVTDAQVAQVRDAEGTDKAAFEIVMAACIGAGLSRWDAATRAIEEADDAPA